MSAGWGALIVGDYKFMKQGCKLWYTPTGKEYSMDGEDCSGDDDDVSAYYRIYNLAEDPYEETNLYGNADYSDIQDVLIERYCYYYNDVMTDNVYQDGDKDGAYDAMDANDNFLTYWMTDATDSSAYPKSDYTYDMCASYANPINPLTGEVEPVFVAEGDKKENLKNERQKKQQQQGGKKAKKANHIGLPMSELDAVGVGQPDSRIIEHLNSAGTSVLYDYLSDSQQ